MLDVPAICDRCGQRYLLKELRELYVLNTPTNTLVCDVCWESSHPQLDTRNVRTDDKQSVPNSRSDQPELAAGRALFSWNPVGCDATSFITCRIGRVTVIAET